MDQVRIQHVNKIPAKNTEQIMREAKAYLTEKGWKFDELKITPMEVIKKLLIQCLSKE